MFELLCIALALVIAGAATDANRVDAANLRAPGLSTESLVTPVAGKKRYKKYKARKCRKGKVYSKRRHKCVWKKKRYRAKTTVPTKSVAPTKKK